MLPRLGLAALAAAGTLAAGPLLRTLWLLDTGSRSTTELPLGIATSARYEAGAGLVLLAVAYGLLVAAAVVGGLAWSRTVMEDDGGFDPQRPRVAAWGLLVGVVAALAFGMSPVTSAIGLDPGPVPERSGLDLLGGLVLTLGTAIWAVLAATLRPRLAVVGAYAGLAAVLATEALGSVLLVIRSPALGSGAGTVGSVLAVVAVTALLLAVAPVRQLVRRPG
jgi:iron complex transport system permease protein